MYKCTTCNRYIDDDTCNTPKECPACAPAPKYTPTPPPTPQKAQCPRCGVVFVTTQYFVNGVCGKCASEMGITSPKKHWYSNATDQCCAVVTAFFIFFVAVILIAMAAK